MLDTSVANFFKNMSGLKLFGHSYNEIGDTKTDFVIKTRGLVKVQWGRKFIDIVRDGKLNVDLDIVERVHTADDIGNQDGIYVTDDGNVFLMCGGQLISLVGDGEGTYVSYIGDQQTTQEAKLQALKNIGIVFKTIEDAKAVITEGFVYIQQDQTFYTVTNGEFTPYPQDISPDPLELDKKAIVILNLGNRILEIKDREITIDAPIYSNTTIQADQFISNIFKSEGGNEDRGLLIINNGNNESTLYVDHIVVRKGTNIQGGADLNSPLAEINEINAEPTALGSILMYQGAEEESEEETPTEETPTEEPTEEQPQAGQWKYFNLGEWIQKMEDCCQEVQEAIESMSKKFIVTWWYSEQDKNNNGQYIYRAEVSNNRYAILPAEYLTPTTDNYNGTYIEDAENSEFQEWDQDYTTIKITNDTNFYAKWYVPEYDVHWIANDQEISTTQVSKGQHAEFDGDTPQPYSESNIVYEFDYWDPNPEEVKITGETTFTAKYKETTLHFEAQPPAISKDGETINLIYWVEDTNGNIITNGITFNVASSQITIDSSSDSTTQDNKKVKTIVVARNESRNKKQYKPYVTYTYNGFTLRVDLTLEQAGKDQIELPAFDIMTATISWEGVDQADLDIAVLFDNGSIVPLYQVDEVKTTEYDASSGTNGVRIISRDGKKYRYTYWYLNGEEHGIEQQIENYPNGEDLYFLIKDDQKIMFHVNHTINPDYEIQDLSKIISGFAGYSRIGSSVTNDIIDKGAADISNYTIYAGDGNSVTKPCESVQVNLRNIMSADFLTFGINEINIPIYAYWLTYPTDRNKSVKLEFKFYSLVNPNQNTFTILDNKDSSGVQYNRTLVKDKLTYDSESRTFQNNSSNIQDITNIDNNTYNYTIETKFNKYSTITQEQIRQQAFKLGTICYKIREKTFTFEVN